MHLFSWGQLHAESYCKNWVVNNPFLGTQLLRHTQINTRDNNAAVTGIRDQSLLSNILAYA